MDSAGMDPTGWFEGSPTASVGEVKGALSIAVLAPGSQGSGSALAPPKTPSFEATKTVKRIAVGTSRISNHNQDFFRFEFV